MPRGTTTSSRATDAPRLDPDRIITAALAVANRDGLSAMTLRKVGAELGADPTAVYRHFASKDHLVVAMADRLFAGVADLPLPQEWRPRLEMLVRAGRDLYRTHSAIAEVLAGSDESSPALVQVNEEVVGCLVDAGLDADDVGRFHQALVSVAIGSGVHEAAWAGGEDRDATRRAYSALDPRDHPLCAALAPHLFPPGDEAFDLLLGIVLDAIEVQATAGRARRSTAPRRASGGRATTQRRTTR
jgi:AcrR family transcriptional regulator